MKLLTIIGARPQIIKAAALSRAIKNSFQNRLSEVIVHTGQHYDSNMSSIFFEELEIPKENYNLDVGSGSHAFQTAEIMVKLEKILLEERPDAVVVYGDTNSTLAGAFAAGKMHIPVVHIEAGMRSFNKKMPEEINRICCDHVSTLLFSPTETGLKNLFKEGFKKSAVPPFSINNPKVYHCGDVMYDNSIYFRSKAEQQSKVLTENKLEKEKFVLATIHRDSNTDVKENLNSLFKAFVEITEEEKITLVIPLHPRTKKMLHQQLKPSLYKSVERNSLIKIIEPVSFLDMIMLEANCKLIMTDSGGVQKESYFFQKPCIILRSETEWVELVKQGTAIICGANKTKIKNAYRKLNGDSSLKFPAIFGDCKAAEFICEQITLNFKR